MIKYKIEDLRGSYWHPKKPFRLIAYDKYGRTHYKRSFKTLGSAKKKLKKLKGDKKWQLKIGKK